MTNTLSVAYFYCMAASYITAEQLTREIGNGQYQPVYYFFGEEEYRKAEGVKYILNDYIPEQQRILNFRRLSADKADFEAISSELAAIPMLGERRLIVIEEVQKLNPTQQKRLYVLLKPPPPETVIILYSSAAGTPRKTSAFFKEVTKIAKPVQFSRLSANLASQRVARQLKAAGFEVDPEAASLLVSLTDGDFGGLVGELEKLSLMTEPGQGIGLEDVKKLTSSYEVFSIFELTDAIAERNTNKALRVYQDLIQKGERPTSILWQLSNHIINLLKVHTGKRVTGAPFFIQKLKEQSKIYKSGSALAALEEIARAEREIRKSVIRPELLVENVIRKISR